MARINIEDSLFKDVRFDDLKIKLGSVDTALGAMVRAWSLAQKWYLKEETSRLIPITEWKKQRISDSILEVGLAEMRGDFIYVSGSDEQFAWLVQKQEAGKKSGEVRRSKSKESVEHKLTDVEQPLTYVNGPEPLSLSPSLSLTPTLSTTSDSISSSSQNVKPKADTELNKKIWESYRDAYAHRWKVDPVRNASVNAKISQLGKRLGSEAIQVVDFFVRHNDQFYLKKRHDIGLCLSDAESLRTQMLSSVSASPQTKAQQTIDHIKDQYQRVMKGEL